MAKFFVYVNDKYMVTVESTTNYAAEHMILDRIPGTQTALSFDDETIRTDTFIGCMLHAETISYDKLVDLFKHRDNIARDVNAAQIALENAKKAVTLAEEALYKAEDERDEIAATLKAYCNSLEGVDAALNIRKQW